LARNYHTKKKGVIAKGVTEVTSFEGLMPDPETLEQLENHCPGITERWLVIAEQEIKERNKNERIIVRSFSFSAVFGSISAFLSTIIIAGVGFYAIYKGYPTAGATIICGSIAQVIAAFHYRTKNNDKD
jgi:uncharacterized membrane protein